MDIEFQEINARDLHSFKTRSICGAAVDYYQTKAHEKFHKEINNVSVWANDTENWLKKVFAAFRNQ
jgi:hypothetical protein